MVPAISQVWQSEAVKWLQVLGMKTYDTAVSLSILEPELVSSVLPHPGPPFIATMYATA